MKMFLERYARMIDTLEVSIPQMKMALTDSWDKMLQPPDSCKPEYFHRIYDGKGRQIIDVKYHSMKEIVENVYHNIVPDDNTQHYLVKKCNGTEKIIRLKCRGLIVNPNE